ncbi:MAG: HlyC/CorC family transporter [Chloroflexi bacterium]|nr:HlyC/CorC family transporter [Chloroflexota bacterium]
MESELVRTIGMVVLALGLLAGAAATEAGFWRAVQGRARDRLEKEGEPAPDVEWLRRNSAWFLAAELTLKAALTVGAIGLTVTVALNRIGSTAAVLALGAGLALALVVLQLVPYSMVLGSGTRTLQHLARAGRWLSYAMVPVAGPLSLLGRWIIGGRPAAAPEEEVRHPGGWTEEGSVAQEQPEDAGHQMLRGILKLDETTAREVMVPRVDIVAVDVDAPLDEVVSLIVARGYSRIPLYEGTLDKIVGIIYAKDLLHALRAETPPRDLRSLARPAYFIPETKRLGDLLREFRAGRVHLAIVVDEYGGTAGLVTIEDLLEEIVGEIEDEYDLPHQDEQVERLSDHEALVDARMSIDDFNEWFDLRLEAEDYHTVGGFVYTQLGRIPNVGDEVRVNGLVLAVISTVGRRIKRVRVERLAGTPARNGHESAAPPETAA